jgi:hypothetical protein
MRSIDCPLVCFFLIFSKSTLILEEYPEQNMKFLEENDIKFLQFGIAGNKVTTLLNIECYLSVMTDRLSYIGTLCTK